MNQLPGAWLQRNLRGLASRITKGTTPTSVGFQFESDGIPFVKIENLRARRVDKALIQQFISDECHKSFSRSQLQPDDILFSIAGTIGKTALVTEADVPANTNQAIAIIRIEKRFIEPRFLRYQLDSIAAHSLKELARGGAMNNVSLADIGQQCIRIAPLPEQKRIADKLDAILAWVDACRERLEARYTAARAQVERLTPALLTKAFRGELVPQDLNDEPASMLLERILAIGVDGVGVGRNKRSVSGIRERRERPMALSRPTAKKRSS